MPRTSIDHTTSKFCVSLLDLCMEKELHIFKGRHESDKKVNFIFMSESRCSVIDYVIKILLCLLRYQIFIYT